ncbi:hypothetical protein PDESU_00271 [Pontiella desulfatans]|uniref:Uncharacterized protein n=1 Tax=Pontiella desulfatans TaxID=2750659 RepID=A0A6C2TVP0_PONDE|nr:hypothetical protein PDESU_00271 [Pontiella desulfatans]
MDADMVSVFIRVHQWFIYVFSPSLLKSYHVCDGFFLPLRTWSSGAATKLFEATEEHRRHGFFTTEISETQSILTLCASESSSAAGGKKICQENKKLTDSSTEAQRDGVLCVSVLSSDTK